MVEQSSSCLCDCHLGFCYLSNPHIQASIKNITLSIGETLGFPKSIESYTEVLNTSKEDKGITVTLKEVVLDNGVLLTKVHAGKKKSSGQKGTMMVRMPGPLPIHSLTLISENYNKWTEN